MEVSKTRDELLQVMDREHPAKYQIPNIPLFQDQLTFSPLSDGK